MSENYSKRALILPAVHCRNRFLGNFVLKVCTLYLLAVDLIPAPLLDISTYASLQIANFALSDNVWHGSFAFSITSVILEQVLFIVDIE
jgi:hypothetical protein